MSPAESVFYAEDQGDGWWHCASPLACYVIDGPGECFDISPSKSTFWLVRTVPAIKWNGDQQFEQLYGKEHPLCNAIEPTSLAIVLARGSNGDTNLDRAFSVPMYPVVNDATSLDDAEPCAGLAAKVTLHRGAARS